MADTSRYVKGTVYLMKMARGLVHPILAHFQREHPREAHRLRGSRLLGYGEYGVVIEHNGDAIKFTLNKQDARASEKLKGLDIPGVVKIKGIRKVGRYYLIRQELLYEMTPAKRDLVYLCCRAMGHFRLDRMTSGKIAKFANPRSKRVKQISDQLVEAIISLRALGIYHLDLQRHNVLQTKSGNVKVIDFGYTRLKHLV